MVPEPLSCTVILSNRRLISTTMFSTIRVPPPQQHGTSTKRYLGNLGSVTFSHNCFYEASGIHSQYEPSDDYKVTENPDMVNPGQTPQQNSDGILSGATVGMATSSMQVLR